MTTVSPGFNHFLYFMEVEVGRQPGRPGSRLGQGL